MHGRTYKLMIMAAWFNIESYIYGHTFDTFGIHTKLLNFDIEKTKNA